MARNLDAWDALSETADRSILAFGDSLTEGDIGAVVGAGYPTRLRDPLARSSQALVGAIP